MAPPCPPPEHHRWLLRSLRLAVALVALGSSIVSTFDPLEKDETPDVDEPRVPWHNSDGRGSAIEFFGDPSPGLPQRTCFHHYGHEAEDQRGEHVRKAWAETKCHYPFDYTCVMIEGSAEMQPYVYKQSYQRGCHFRCPCPDSQPWQEWYQTQYSGNENWRQRVALYRRWEKHCILDKPPTGYAIGSSALPWEKSKPLVVRCCKKHWDWIGHPNDTMKHEVGTLTTADRGVIEVPRFRENYNRSVDVRIGYWGTEKPKAQPPVLLDPDHVMWGAENCNGWGSNVRLSQAPRPHVYADWELEVLKAGGTVYRRNQEAHAKTHTWPAGS